MHLGTEQGLNFYSLLGYKYYTKRQSIPAAQLRITTMSYDDCVTCDECGAIGHCDAGEYCRGCRNWYCSEACCEDAGCDWPEEITDEYLDDFYLYTTCKYCRREMPLEIKLRGMFDDALHRGQDWKSYDDWLDAMATAIREEQAAGTEAV